MRKIILIVGIIFFASLSMLFADEVQEEWVRIHDGSDGAQDHSNAIALDSQGNIYVTGETYGVGCTTIKYDNEGNELWVRDVEGYKFKGNDIIVDAQDNVYVAAGESVVKYDAQGNELWLISIDYSAFDIKVDRQGNIYLTGNEVYESPFGGFISKYDTNGNELWVRQYDDYVDGSTRSNAIALDSEGNAYVATEVSGNYETIKYDSEGNEVWSVCYDSSVYDVAKAITIDDSGAVYVSGYSFNDLTDAYQVVTVQYNPESGQEQWVRMYDGPYGYYPYNTLDVALDKEGNICIAATIFNFETDDSNWNTLKYNSQGELLWAQQYDGPASFYDTPQAMAIDSQDNIYVTGKSYGHGTSYDFTTIKYDSQGNQKWVMRYARPEDFLDDTSRAIAVDNNGNVYITGSSYNVLGDGYEDYITIKYSPVIIHVPADYSTIQGAIDVAEDGDTILVAAGTYVENINFNGKKITLKSESGSKNTIIDGGSYIFPAYAVIFQSGETQGAILDGFTIVNGRIGGVACAGSSSPVISRNIINPAESAVGITCSESSSPNLINNIISGDSYSVGIGCSNQSSPLIANNTIVGGRDYGILFLYDSKPTVTNNIIVDCKGDGVSGNGSAILSYNDFWNNYRDYGGYGYEFPGVGDVVADPLFVDKVNKDYRLNLGSPCIDAGDPASDYSSEPEPNGNRINMGNYGNTAEATASIGFQPDVSGQVINVYELPMQLSGVVLSLNAIAADQAQTVDVTVEGVPDWLQCEITPGNPTSIVFSIDKTLKQPAGFGQGIALSEVKPIKPKQPATVTITASTQAIPEESVSTTVTFKASRKTGDSVINKPMALSPRR